MVIIMIFCTDSPHIFYPKVILTGCAEEKPAGSPIGHAAMSTDGT